MLTQSTVRRGPRYRNGNYAPVSAPLSDAIRDSARRVYRDGFRAAKLYALDKNRISLGRRTGGTLAALKQEMQASPEFARLAAIDVQAFANAITSARELCFLATSRDEQRDDGDEDSAQIDALTNPTPETLDRYIEKAERARASLDLNIEAAKQMRQRMMESSQ